MQSRLRAEPFRARHSFVDSAPLNPESRLPWYKAMTHQKRRQY